MLTFSIINVEGLVTNGTFMHNNTKLSHWIIQRFHFKIIIIFHGCLFVQFGPMWIVAIGVSADIEGIHGCQMFHQFMEKMFVCILGDLVQNKPISNVASNRNEALNVGSTVGSHSKADGF